MTEQKRITPKEFVKSAAYLPDVMRDFHDQKDIFKAIHETTNVEKHEYAGSVSWVVGQCYVVDIFLWWMAQRGYTLQRSRKPVEFRDLQEDVAAARSGRDASMASLLGLSKAGVSP
jgi:hypothetical protein